MKNLKFAALAIAFAFTTNISAQTAKKINTNESKVNWVGKKLTGQHSGTINLKEGSLVFKGKNLVGGNFTVDMTTINTTDLKAGEGKENLDGHLKADDFFGVEKFPMATLVFKKIGVKSPNVYVVNADMTIKGITKEVNFDLAFNKKTATTKFMVDRTQYGIKYKSKSVFSDLGDKFVDDNFELAVNLKM